ncbi:hypothetical protein D3C78_1093990 [compost metagenome]
MPKSIQERLIKWAVDMEWHNFHGHFQRNQYYIPYPHMLRKCYGLSMNERSVLLDIISHLGENDEAFPSQETIACNLGLSESTVKSAINALVKKRFIKTVRRRGHVNRYRIDALEDNPYVGMSETIHYFLRLYQPKYIKRSAIQSVISAVVNSDSYAKYANKLYEVYRSPYTDQSYPDLVLDTQLELMMEIRNKLRDEKGLLVSVPIFADFQKHFNLYLERIGFDDGDECDWDNYLASEEEQNDDTDEDKLTQQQ